MKKVLISTGGTGGHVIPALNIYEHLKKDHKVKIISDLRGSRFINKEKYEFDVINVPNLFSNYYKIPINIILILFSLIRSIIYLKKNKIQILISTGGYMSLPVCIASKILKIDIFLFEPNMILGRSNKAILILSKKIMCYYKNIKGVNSKFRSKIIILDFILNKDFYSIEKNQNLKISNPIKIFITGGSQGASFFDENLKNLITNLSETHNIQVLQQVSNEKKIDVIKEKYDTNGIDNKLFKYDEYLHQKISNFDLAITRAGASTLSELAHLNIPFIALPYPHATDNHQYLNAKYYFDKGACWLIKQSEYDESSLTKLMQWIIENNSEYLQKKNQLKNISLKSSWNRVNDQITNLINEN